MAIVSGLDGTLEVMFTVSVLPKAGVGFDMPAVQCWPAVVVVAAVVVVVGWLVVVVPTVVVVVATVVVVAWPMVVVADRMVVVVWTPMVVVEPAVVDEVDNGTVLRAAVPKVEPEPEEVVDVVELAEVVVVVPEPCPWPPVQAAARKTNAAAAMTRDLITAP